MGGYGCGYWSKSLFRKFITVLYDVQMKTLITLLLACCFGSAMAQSNLPACGGDPSRWDQCYGTDRSYYREIRGFVGKYSGEWVRGMPSGQGVLILPNGQGYVEASEIPKHPGIARKFVSDGGRYIGYFKNGLYDGSGVQYSKSGAVEKAGIWKDGNLVQSKFIDVATFTRIPNLSNRASNLAQLRVEAQPGIRNPRMRVMSLLSKLPECAVGQHTGCIAQIGDVIGPIKNGRFDGVAIGHSPSGYPINAGIYEDGKFLRSLSLRDVPASLQVTSIAKVPTQQDDKPVTELDQLRVEAQPGIRNPRMRVMSLLSKLPECAVGQHTGCIAQIGDVIGPIKNGRFDGVAIGHSPSGYPINAGIYEDGKFLRSLSLRDVPASLQVTSIAKVPTQQDDKPVTELDQLRAEAEQAKSEKAELEAQLAAAQQQAQVKPTAKIAPQGKRVALVIGNAKYKFSPLNNPVNDATDMAASLRSVGFDVIEIRDANKRQMRAATRRFEDKLAASDVGLVYYSGHGVEVKGRNYLIPVDADIRREHEVEDQAFDAGNILRMMESLQGTEKKRVNIMIVDACRNNDLARSWRSTNRGLARMDAPTGSFISFATAPGQVASDGNGRNSPFTKHLLQALKQPNVPIELVFKEVRRNVMAETAGEQVPWENSSLVGDFYFTVAR